MQARLKVINERTAAVVVSAFAFRLHGIERVFEAVCAHNAVPSRARGNAEPVWGCGSRRFLLRIPILIRLLTHGRRLGAPLISAVRSCFNNSVRRVLAVDHIVFVAEDTRIRCTRNALSYLYDTYFIYAYRFTHPHYPVVVFLLLLEHPQLHSSCSSRLYSSLHFSSRVLPPSSA